MALVRTHLSRQRVWRVGYRPNPWAWSDWVWAQDGRFSGRWDDPNGLFRTLYVGDSLTACLLEVLAPLRADVAMQINMMLIVEDDDDAEQYPTVQAGSLPRQWLDARCAGRALLSGDFCDVTASGTILALHPHFVGRALAYGRKDFDAAALKDSELRGLTQEVSAWLYEHADVDGVEFRSRHGDDLRLWAIYEQPGDGVISSHITGHRIQPLEATDPHLVAAMVELGLFWTD